MASRLALLFLLCLSGAVVESSVTAAPRQDRAKPIWPVPELLDQLQGMLLHYYDQEADPATARAELAPDSEADKRRAAKDPDTLWEALAAQSPNSHPGLGLMTRCHSAETPAQYLDCTASRLTRATHIGTSRAATLYQAEDGYYRHQELVLTAGYFALYHAFVRDFDAPIEQSCRNLPRDRVRRQYKCYHERMIRAYETHMRHLLVQMFSQRRADIDVQYQLDLSRSVGWLATPYTWTVQAMEEYGLWQTPTDRRDALALLNGLGQRVWWEWVEVQPDGPRTAGKAAIGSRRDYDDAVARDPAKYGSHQFLQGSRRIESLRPAAMARAGFDGLWFDADYTVPGEAWCKDFGINSSDWLKCVAHARQESLGGSHSPFGDYFGLGDCSRRASHPTTTHCGETSLGSIAEEWLAIYVGARGAMRAVELASDAGDRDAPSAEAVPRGYAAVTARLGYGVAGFHGGDGRDDDLEWTFEGETIAIRTLSSARHDTEPQHNRYSLGELDESGVSSGTNGDTWAAGGEEYPGAIENHTPGPNPLYGSTLFGLVLSDKVEGGMSPSLYSADPYRNNPDEFDAWIWLLQSTYYRCRGVDDPIDDACFAFSPDHWPFPVDVRREALFIDPADRSVPIGVRYLWRKPAPPLRHESVAEADAAKRGLGLPWAQPDEYGERPESNAVLVAEQGYGAWGLMLQGAGGFMRLAAARYDEPAPAPSFEQVYRTRRDHVIAPWYFEMHRLVEGIIHRFGDPEAGYGYIPDVENSRRIHFGEEVTVRSWFSAGNGGVEATIARRARLYSSAALWYWMYDSNWLDVDRRWAGETVPTATPFATIVPTAGPPPTATPSPTQRPTAVRTAMPTESATPPPVVTAATTASRTATAASTREPLPSPTRKSMPMPMRLRTGESDLWVFSKEANRFNELTLSVQDWFIGHTNSIGPLRAPMGSRLRLPLSSLPSIPAGLHGAQFRGGVQPEMVAEHRFPGTDSHGRVRQEQSPLGYSLIVPFVLLGPETAIGIFNPDASNDANISISVHESGVSGPVAYHRLAIEPGHGQAAIIGENIGPYHRDGTRVGYVRLEANVPIAATALIDESGTGNSAYDVPARSQAMSSGLVLPVVSSGYPLGDLSDSPGPVNSEILLTNVGATVQEVRIEYRIGASDRAQEACQEGTSYMHFGEEGETDVRVWPGEVIRLSQHKAGNALGSTEFPAGCVGAAEVTLAPDAHVYGTILLRQGSGQHVASIPAMTIDAEDEYDSYTLPVLDGNGSLGWTLHVASGEPDAIKIRLFDDAGSELDCRLRSICEAQLDSAGASRTWHGSDFRFLDAHRISSIRIEPQRGSYMGALAAVAVDAPSADRDLTAYLAPSESGLALPVMHPMLLNHARLVEGARFGVPTAATPWYTATPTSGPTSPTMETPFPTVTALPSATPFPTATRIIAKCQNAVLNGDFDLPFLAYWKGDGVFETDGCFEGNCLRLRSTLNPATAWQGMPPPVESGVSYISYRLRSLEGEGLIDVTTRQGSLPRTWDRATVLAPSDGWVISGYPIFRRDRAITEVSLTVQGEFLIDDVQIMHCPSDLVSMPQIFITSTQPVIGEELGFSASGFLPSETVVVWSLDPTNRRIHTTRLLADVVGNIMGQFDIEDNAISGEWYVAAIGEASRVPNGVYVNLAPSRE